jgi:hypothetical protein
MNMNLKIQNLHKPQNMNMSLKNQNLHKPQNMNQNIHKPQLHQNTSQNIHKPQLNMNMNLKHQSLHQPPKHQNMNQNIQKLLLNQNMSQNIRKLLLNQNMTQNIHQNIHNLLLLRDTVENLMVQKELNLIHLHPPLEEVRAHHLLQPLLHHNALKAKIASSHAILSSRNLEENVIQFQERNTTQTSSTILPRLNDYF